jgi:hypothetical protein
VLDKGLVYYSSLIEFLVLRESAEMELPWIESVFSKLILFLSSVI